MPAKTSRRIVIDASIAQSSGKEDATYPRSKHCRDFLLTVLEVCHRVVMTTEILEEWNRHQSSFARGWRVSMVARKKLSRIEVVPDQILRDKITRTATKEVDREAILKDLRLIDAAIATDLIIASLDETVRELFRRAATNVGELRNIVWTNPELAEENCISWLAEGARAERKRKLGYVESTGK